MNSSNGVYSKIYHFMSARNEHSRYDYPPFTWITYSKHEHDDAKRYLREHNWHIDHED